jgi:hypothetical protein
LLEETLEELETELLLEETEDEVDVCFEDTLLCVDDIDLLEERLDVLEVAVLFEEIEDTAGICFEDTLL